MSNQTEKPMSAEEFTENLVEILETGLDDEFIYIIDTFQNMGVCSGSKGVVVQMTNGAEYQITVVRSN